MSGVSRYFYRLWWHGSNSFSTHSTPPLSTRPLLHPLDPSPRPLGPSLRPFGPFPRPPDSFTRPPDPDPEGQSGHPFRLVETSRGPELEGAKPTYVARVEGVRDPTWASAVWNRFHVQRLSATMDADTSGSPVYSYSTRSV